jgi:nucleoside-diphosphate-sugar epimerase
MSTVAFLGASGQLGRLLRAVWPQDARALWISRAAGPGVIQCDMLADPAGLVVHLAGAQTVVCLAGVTHTSDQDMRLNSTLAEAAITAAHDAGVPAVLLASSAAVYGSNRGILDESDPCTPVSDYGRAKLDMERTGCDLAQRLSPRVTSLRIGNIAGADAILGGWRPGFQLDRFEDGTTPRRSYIGLVTLARVLRHLGTVSTLPPVLNVAAPGVFEMGDLLDAAGLDWTARPAPSSAIPSVALATDRLRQYFQFEENLCTPQALVAEWRQATGATQG